MGRITRYQGAIIQDDHILLIQQREYASGREYWLIPGGGREDGESEEQCVRREMKEETHLEVMVERLLLDEAAQPGGFYRRYKTYLCRPVGGEARPGHEPEFDVMEGYEIAAVKWFDLRSEMSWEKQVLANPFTYPLLQRIRAALGYGADGVT